MRRFHQDEVDSLAMKILDEVLIPLGWNRASSWAWEDYHGDRLSLSLRIPDGPTSVRVHYISRNSYIESTFSFDLANPECHQQIREFISNASSSYQISPSSD